MLAPLTLIRRPLQRPSDALPRRTESRTDPRLKMTRAVAHASRSTDVILNATSPRTARLPATTARRSASSTPSLTASKLPTSRIKRTSLPVDRSKALRAPSSIPMMTITEAPAVAETLPEEHPEHVDTEVQKPVPSGQPQSPSSCEGQTIASPVDDLTSGLDNDEVVRPSELPPPYLKPSPVDAVDMPQSVGACAAGCQEEDDVIVLEHKMTPAEARRLTKNQLMDEMRERNLPFRANEKKDVLCDRLIAAL